MQYIGIFRKSVLKILRNYKTTAITSQKGSGSSSTSVKDVPGFSPNVYKPPTGLVGPNVDPEKIGPYKVPEYFSYNNMSFFEAEVEMAKYRLQQPSALEKSTPPKPK